MFKHIWSKFKALISPTPEVEESPTPSSEQEKIVLRNSQPMTQISTCPPKPELPRTLGDMIEKETIKTPEVKPIKKPRKPRAKKVPASPEVLAVYAEPKAEETEKLDTRLDGYATKPKKLRRRKPKVPAVK